MFALGLIAPGNFLVPMNWQDIDDLILELNHINAIIVKSVSHDPTT